MHAQPPGIDQRQCRRHGDETDLHFIGDQRIEIFGGALVRHAHDVDARHQLQQFAADMRRRAVGARGVVELARIGFGVIDQFAHALHRQRRMHQQQAVRQRDEADGRKILQRVVRAVWRAGSAAPRGWCSTSGSYSRRGALSPSGRRRSRRRRPGRLSSTTGWPRPSPSARPIARATMSVLPPADEITIMRIGLSG